MRRALSAIAVAMVLVLASVLFTVAHAGGGVNVPATVPWSFGAFVDEGVTYDVSASGMVQTAKIPYFHVPGAAKSQSGPAGQPDQPCLALYESDVNGQCMLEGTGFGTLLGLVIDGNTGNALAAPFAIGAGPSFVAPASGVLMLAVNDLNLTYWDNNGAFNVSVTPH